MSVFNLIKTEALNNLQIIRVHQEKKHPHLCRGLKYFCMICGRIGIIGLNIHLNLSILSYMWSVWYRRWSKLQPKDMAVC